MFTIRSLTISPQMKPRLDLIEALISEGYTLNKIWGYYPDLKTPSGKSVNIFGSILPLSGPAGFSWVAFFFPWAVCTQIREWSFFYLLFIFSLLGTISDIFFETPPSIINLLTCYSYGSMFPYLRYLATKRDVEEIPKTSSILIGFVLYLLALTPSLILAFLTNTIVILELMPIANVCRHNSDSAHVSNGEVLALGEQRVNKYKYL